MIESEIARVRAMMAMHGHVEASNRRLLRAPYFPCGCYNRFQGMAVATHPGVPPPVAKLAPKQRAFAIEYVRLQDATDAAKAAGYSHKNARQYGFKMLAREDVNEAIDALLYQSVVRAGITSSRVINEIATIAFDRTLDVKDRLKALDMLARHHGIYNDKLNVTIDKDTLEQAAKDAGVPVEVIEAEYRLITEGKG